MNELNYPNGVLGRLVVVEDLALARLSPEVEDGAGQGLG